MLKRLDDGLVTWLNTHAEALDSDQAQADQLLPMLASGGLFRVAVPVAQGGTGGPGSDAVAVAATLAEHSLAAAFVFWAQRVVVECVLRSPNRELAQDLLPPLLDGTLAGAPGLSNAMRSLGGLGKMQSQFMPAVEGAVVQGGIPWATNLRRDGFVAVIAAEHAADASQAVFAVPHCAAGVSRGNDQDLLGLRATNTAALKFDDVLLAPRWEIHPHAKTFLPEIRPMMLAIQCGLGLGLATASLRAARSRTIAHSILVAELDELECAIGDYWCTLSTTLDAGHFETAPAELFDLRIKMVALATSAVHLELQALGARAYDRGANQDFARRMREAAFLPILTPSLVQIKTALARVRTAS